MSGASEVSRKIETVRAHLRDRGLGAARLRGIDWFGWCAAGGFNGMLMTSEVGVAEILVGHSEAWVLTDVIEAERLRQEEVPRELQVWSAPWQDLDARERFIRSRIPQGQRLASDRPEGDEEPLPPGLREARLQLQPEEIMRLAELGRDSAKAMTRAMKMARPDWSERDLAAEGARALVGMEIDPALVQVGGESRVDRFRHVLPTKARLGRRAMMAFCARRGGLYVSLTRFVYFEDPDDQERKRFAAVARIEAAALESSRPGTELGEVYSRLAAAYREEGFGEELDRHHQGGISGYLAREVIARPGCRTRLAHGTSVAWNPSLKGVKIEDTFVCTDQGVTLMTYDPEWPAFECCGRTRPEVLVNGGAR